MRDTTIKDDQYVPNLTADVVASFVSYNSLNPRDLAPLVGAVAAAFQAMVGSPDPEAPAALVPAVPINKSVTPSLIYCLENGKGYKSLKRHLWTAYEMTPEQYRAKWNLPADYPMVAPEYSAIRSALAVSAGLGRLSGAGRSKATSK